MAPSGQVDLAVLPQKDDSAADGTEEYLYHGSAHKDGSFIVEPESSTPSVRDDFGVDIFIA